MAQALPTPVSLDDIATEDVNTILLGFVGLAWVTYDAFITFEQDNRLVWHGRWGVPSIIYVITHYGIILQSVLNITFALDVTSPGRSCIPQSLVADWGIPVFMLLVEAMLMLRVTALWGNDRRVAIPLWILYFVSVSVMFLLVILPIAGVMNVDELIAAGCEASEHGVWVTALGSEGLFWTIWIPSLILELTMVIMTLTSSIIHRRRGVRTRLLTVLMRDGFVYFVVVFAHILLNVVICLTAPMMYYSLFAQITICSTCVLSSRLFLNLREVAYRSKLQDDKSGPSAVYELHAMGDHRTRAPSPLGIRAITSSFVETSFFEREDNDM